jgi:hypothetical protein
MQIIGRCWVAHKVVPMEADDDDVIDDDDLIVVDSSGPSLCRGTADCHAVSLSLS